MRTLTGKDCELKKVSLKEAKKFVNKHTDYGAPDMLYAYGLYYDNKLVKILVISKPLTFENFEYRISCVTGDENYDIHGIGELWDVFVREHHPVSCVYASHPKTSREYNEVLSDFKFKNFQSPRNNGLVPQLDVWYADKNEHPAAGH
jgi:hypothetical protein